MKLRSVLGYCLECVFSLFLLFGFLTAGARAHSYFNKTSLSYKPAKVFQYRHDFDDLSAEQQQEFVNADATIYNSKSREEYNKALPVWNKLRDIMGARERELILCSRLPDDKIRSLVNEFSVKIEREPIHDLFDQCGEIWVEEGMNDFISKTGNRHPDYSYPVIFQEWMGAFGCHTYAFHMIRREDPYEFVDPHGELDPIGLMIAQGYNPIPATEIGENDLVFYFSFRDDPDFDPSEHPPGGPVRSSHYGVFKKGKVLSKQLFAGIAHHTLSAGGFPGWRYMIFRKDFNPESPIPAIDGNEWIETDLCVTRVGGHFKYSQVFGSTGSWEIFFGSIGYLCAQLVILKFKKPKEKLMVDSE